ncbi:MAG: T9SS type A sorting domain-containing protein [Saprospiraceae bacterium]|nr:T9SS type A sorting domain-containing protein [Saprospiraceae bacterium]MCB9320169.1 T9SS type A sorting domain-containing protein [Lewinellaceae bacterium]
MIRIYIAFFLSGLIGITNAQAQGCTLSCHDLVNISLDSACQRTIVPADLLTGNPSCFYLYTVELTYGSSNLGNMVTKDYIGKTLNYAVIDTSSNNRCTGKVKIEDKYPPTTRVPDVTISCFDPYPNLSNLHDACGFTLAVTQRGYDLEYYPCGSTYEGLYSRYLRISDPWGNFRDDTQMVYLTRPDFSSLVCPSDKTLACDLKVGNKYLLQDPAYVVFDKDGYAHPKPIVNKETRQSTGLVDPPAIRNSQGQLSYLWDTDGACHLAVDYSDVVIADCGYGYKIRREWTVYDWCTHEERHCTQWIYIKDNYGPQLVKPKDITVATGTSDCKANVSLPWPELKSACGGGSAAFAQSYYEILRVNDDHYHTTTKILQGDLTPAGAQAWVEPGHYEVWYVLEDKCKRVSKTSFLLDVYDLTPPVAKCKPSQQKSLDGCSSKIWAKDLNAGSSDNCCSVIHVAIALSDSVTYYREYWTNYLKSCLGSSLYKQKQSDYEALVEDWINLFVFDDYVDVQSCGNVKLELRAFPACGMTTKAQAGYPGSDHSWFCITAYPDYFCHYADHYLDEGHPRPGIVCNKSASTKAYIDFCNATMSSIYSRLGRDGVDSKTIDKMKSWQWVSAQQPYTGGYGSCTSTWTFTSQANWSLQGAPDATVFSDGTPGKGVLETAGLHIILTAEGNADALDCSEGTSSTFNTNYGYNQFKDFSGWQIDGYTTDIPTPAYCPSWLALDYYNGRTVQPASLFVDPQVTDGCSSIQLTSKTTTSNEGNNTVYTKTWTAKDGCSHTRTATQKVILQPRSDFEATFPADTLIGSMDSLSETVQIADDEEESLSIDHQDELFDANGTRYIVRKWIVRDLRFSGASVTGPDIIVDDRILASPDRMVPRNLKDNGDGIMEYLQLIELRSQDTVAPVIACASDTFELCVNPILCLTDTSLVLGEATDDQPATLQYHYEVWADTIMVSRQAGASLDLPLLAGVYHVVLSVVDGGGNSASCTAALIVTNCDPVGYSFKDSISLSLDSFGIATLVIDSLINGETIACDLSSEVSFSTDTLLQRIAFSCGDPAGQLLAVYTLVNGAVTDTAGVWVSIENKGEICQPCGPLTPCPDSIPPMLICASQEFRICTNPLVCLSDTSFLLGLGMDETTVAEHLHFHYRVLQQGDTLAEREGHLFDLPLLAGVYTIELMVEDAAGNQAMCRSELTIEDCCSSCSGLVVLCQDTVERAMTENKQAMVLLDDVDAGSFDDCGGELYRSFRRDTLMPYRVITCADSSNLNNGVLALIWYIGVSGEILDSCTTQVKVLDFGTYCAPQSEAPLTKTAMNRELMVYNDPVQLGKSIHGDVPEAQGLNRSSGTWQLTLTPNPAYSQVMARVEAPETGNTTLHIIGLDGKVWVTQEVQVVKGINQVVLSLAALPSGLYSVMVSSPEPKQIARLVKQ